MSEIPKNAFKSLADLKRLHEERDLQIFEAETKLKLIREQRQENERRLAAAKEEDRVVDMALQSSVSKLEMLNETFVQRMETLKILEREVAREKNELNQAEAESEAEKERIKEELELEGQRRQEAVRDIWSKFPGYDEYTRLTGELDQVREKIRAIESRADQKRLTLESGRKKTESIAAKKLTLENLTNQLNSLNQRKSELKAKNEQLLRDKAAKKAAEEEAAKKAAQEAAAERASEEKAAREAAAKRADEEADARMAREPDELGTYAEDNFGEENDGESGFNEGQEYDGYEEEEEDDDVRGSDPNWTLPFTDSVPSSMRLSTTGTPGFGQVESFPQPMQNSFSRFDFSGSLAESTPSNTSRLSSLVSGGKMVAPPITPISSGQRGMPPSADYDIWDRTPEKRPGLAVLQSGPDTSKVTGAVKKSLFDFQPREREKRFLISPEKSSNVSKVGPKQTTPPKAAGSKDETSLSSPTPPKVMKLDASSNSMFIFAGPGKSAGTGVVFHKSSSPRTPTKASITNDSLSRLPGQQFAVDLFGPLPKGDRGRSMSEYSGPIGSASGDDFFLSGNLDKPPMGRRSSSSVTQMDESSRPDDSGDDFYYSFGGSGRDEQDSSQPGDSAFSFTAIGNSSSNFFRQGDNDDDNNQSGGSTDTFPSVFGGKSGYF